MILGEGTNEIQRNVIAAQIIARDRPTRSTNGLVRTLARRAPERTCAKSSSVSPSALPSAGTAGCSSPLTATQLGVAALTGLLARSGLDPDAVDDVILGHCYPTSEAPAIGRVVALDAGLPVSVGGQQIDRRCGSGLQAAINAVLQVSSGGSDVVIAGGVESMSNAAFYSLDLRWGGARSGVQIHDGPRPGPSDGRRDQLPGARRDAGDRREPAPRLLDQPGGSRTRWPCSRTSGPSPRSRTGILAEEIVPTTVRTRAGDEVIVTDEHPRPDASSESLARLRPAADQDRRRGHGHGRQRQRGRTTPRRWPS